MAIEQWGSLACHVYCGTGHPFIMVISEDPWHSHLLPSVKPWAITTWFCDLGLSRLEFEHPTFRLRGLCSNLLRYRGGLHLRIILLLDGRYIVHVHRYCYKGVIRMKTVNIYGHLLRKCIFSRLILLSIPPFNRNVLCCETIFSKILLFTR